MTSTAAKHDEGEFQGRDGLRLYYQCWLPDVAPALTMRFIAEPDAAVRRGNAQAGMLRVPVLILCGSDDRAVPPSSTMAYFERVGSPEKEFNEYAGGYTNLLSDSVTEAVLADIDHWLDQIT